jgi:DNA-binding transcriptional MocR family regulator
MRAMQLIKNYLKQFLRSCCFRKTLSDYVYNTRGVLCNPEQIVIGSGVQTLLHTFCDIIRGTYKGIAFEGAGFIDLI